MTTSHRTTAVRRPVGVHTGSRSSGSSGTRSRTRLGDLTTSVPRERRLLPMPLRPLFWLGGAVVMAAVVAALFVLPVRDWFAQDEALAEKRSELAVLEQTNTELAAANARLQTDDGVREAAREEIGYVMPGEQRQTVMPVPAAPATLPAGWPYDTISQIIAVQSSPPPAAPPAAPAAIPVP